ncbi:toll/interleukin-1 receptor domain-containing protein [Serratia fonticola]|uniref:toll/interleukin-1 receptor domain-containing protein n=1 Tax=Serratia fonticola TaxID=47917 RepID=UPI0027F6E8F3|nr:toll/interleukin-1 receptor domain-containing protein [Serratia fonticola]MDQ7211668.1 toll/interleukin-1 receptor domain-containing protein [Serratia fonticola]HBE9081606.1 toll/interleukin-1 receptor domain-containing protein [Serratia fonticola]HBE9092304.1 toll/interleukin-1 receptor domain-containing protein [Serratia fonticola]HBE9154433.1 toll/interleukin-1 receptor domain-containing protein [Serratia fonticola]
MFLYHIAVMGSPSTSQLAGLQTFIDDTLSSFQLVKGKDVDWQVCPASFSPPYQKNVAVIYYCDTSPVHSDIPRLLELGIPIIPVVSSLDRVETEVPIELRHLNCMASNNHDINSIGAALLECAGLLAQERRVFLSYRRTESREAAIQLYDELGARQFDVFLDTHGIRPGQQFQSKLWHHLCDSDVLIMLDTETYFESMWSSAEYGRALAKNISIIQVVWPGRTPDKQTSTAFQEILQPADILETGYFTEQVIQRLCSRLEEVRSKGYAVRTLNLIDRIRTDISRIRGTFQGVGPGRSVHFSLMNGKTFVAYPTMGVPSSTTLHNACLNTPGHALAIVYDSVGMDKHWLKHLQWIGSHVKVATYIPVHKLSWELAGQGAN